MCRKLIPLVSVVLTLGVISGAYAQCSIGPEETLTVTGTDYLVCDRLEVQGTLIVENGGQVTYSSTSEVHNNGQIIVNEGGEITGNARFDMDAGGTIVMNGGLWRHYNTFKVPDNAPGPAFITMNGGMLWVNDMQTYCSRNALITIGAGILRVDDTRDVRRDPQEWLDNGCLVPAEGSPEIIIAPFGANGAEVSTTHPAVTLVSPEDYSIVDTTSVEFTCSAADEVGLKDATLYVGSSSETLTFSGPDQTDDAQLYATDDPDTGEPEGPDTNAGTAVSINVDSLNPHAHAVIRFPNVFGDPPGQVPPGSTIVSATLEVNCFNLGDLMKLYRLTEDWVEGEVTWNERQSGVSWTNLGADGSGSNAGVALDGDCTATGWRTIDITQLVQEWSDGAANYGIVLTDTGTDGIDFDSSESANPPVLTVSYGQSGLQLIETLTMSGTSDTVTFGPITLADQQDYVWNCLVTNTSDEENWAPADFHLTVDTHYVPPVAVILKGPYLQQLTADSIVIMWETDVAADSRVDFDGTFVEDATPVTIHEMLLTGLSADSVYGYTVTSGTTTSPASTFSTAPATERSFRFAAYGDSRTQSSEHAAVVQGIINSAPEIVLHTGDIVASGRYYDEWGPQFFDPAHDLMMYTPLLPVLGNHEYNGSGQLWFLDFFSVGNNDEWFAFTYGGVRFIGLNTMADYSSGSEQYNWLVSQLQSSAYNDATWHIVYFHHPPYTATSSHSDEIGVQEHLVPLFELYGVDMVFNGHSHAYERYFNNGIYYIVTGGGGAPLADLDEDTTEPIRQVGVKAYHHCVIDVDVDNSSLTLEARYNDGTMFDTITITKTQKATNPDPPDGATQVALDADLSWTAGIGATEHYVYLWYIDGEQTLYVANGDVTAIPYDPGILAYETTYYWRIDEYDGVATHQGDVWSFTTVPAYVDDVANADIPVAGTVSGSYVDTQSSDDVYEAVTERQSGGKPSKRYSYLEHKWTFNVIGGDMVTFYVEAYHTANSEGDNFVFAYSTDDSTYTDMLTVTKTSDDNTYQTYVLPGVLSGTVYIRVTDTDETPGNKSLDTISIDHMYIRCEGAGEPDTEPPSPSPMTWATEPYATGSGSISMTATTASDASGVEYYFACTAGGGHDSGWQDSPTYEDTGLMPETQYTYKVQARDKSANQNETGLSIARSATTDPQVGDVVTITKAEYKAARSELNVEATSSEGGTAVFLTVVGYEQFGVMTYDSRKNIYKLKMRPADDPGGEVTVTSSLGGSATKDVTYK